MSEANRRLVQRWQEAYNAGDLDALDEILAPDWTTNAWTELVPKSVDSAKHLHRAALAVFPDLHYSTGDLFAGGSWVAQRYIARGTFRGETSGLPPTGNVVQWGGVNIFRIARGRIVEHWGYADDLGVLRQLGAPVDARWLASRHR